MFKIDGLDKLQKNLDEAVRAMENLDGELGSVNFDPTDPVSIEAAIASMEQLIDEKVGHHPNNSIVANLGNEMKEKYRESILEKAAEARLQDRPSED
ncbi:MAG TPA: hypothetical protein ENJ42_08790 [Hellea balneolensis]|uniref:Uncharacterized protein n=1 Tax=Hellea balneolensis TaxID=287478 RepID=A0A7C5QQE6_9PROT|nr:hypothetical protein [Hellea balneolensis]